MVMTDFHTMVKDSVFWILTEAYYKISRGGNSPELMSNKIVE